MQHRIGAALESFSEHPREADIKKLKGQEDTFRLRVGDYRVVWTLFGKMMWLMSSVSDTGVMCTDRNISVQKGDQMNVDRIKELAFQFRKAILLSDRSKLRILLENFLGGLVATHPFCWGYLKDMGEGTFEYVCGVRYHDRGRDGDHAWIEKDGYIIDITADQFTKEIKVIR